MKNQIRSLFRRFDKVDMVIIVGMLLLAIFLRLPPLLPDRFVFFLDAARDLSLIDQFIQTSKPMLIGGRSGIQGIFHGPLWLYMVTPLFLIAKGNPYMTVLLSIICYTFTLVVVSYLLSKYFYSRRFAIIFTLLISTASGLITFTPTLTNAHMAPIVFIVFLFAGISYMRGNQKAIIWQFIMIGLCIHFEAAFAVFLPVLILLQSLISKQIPSVKNSIIGLILLGFTVCNYIFFELRHALLMTNTALNLLTGKLTPPADSLHLQVFSVRAVDRLLGLFDYFLRPAALFNSGLNIVFACFILIISIWLLIKLKQTESKREIFWLLSIPFVYYLIFMLYKQILWGHYSFALYSSASLLLALILFKSLEQKGWIQISAKIFMGLIVISIVIAIVKVPITIASKSSREYKAQYEAASYVIRDGVAPIHYFVYDPGQLTYKMDYIFKYVSKVNNKQIDTTKTDVIYVFLYPAPIWNPGGGQWWKENILKTNGKVLIEKKFGNIITVQKIKVGVDEKPVDANYFQNLFFR